MVQRLLKNFILDLENKEPFHSELYSSDQMVQYGEIVARSHKLQKRNSYLVNRVIDNILLHQPVQAFGWLFL